MAYRTVIVLDGANNLIECQMNLTDYSQRGNHPSLETFVDLELGPRENQALQQFILDLINKRNEPPPLLKKLIVSRQQENSYGAGCGDMVASRYSQRGVIPESLIREESQPSDNPPAPVASAFWDEENRFTMQFSGGDPIPGRNLLDDELPIFSCPFMNALRELDDMTSEEKRKILEVMEMRNRLPFSFPDGGFEFRQRRPASRDVFGVTAKEAPPDSPLTNGWTNKAKRERAKLTVSVNGEESPDNDKEYDGCAYGKGELKCPRPKKRSQIYCGHHLRLVSHKHQTQKALKRSRSSVDFGHGDDRDIDYNGIGDGESPHQ